MYIEFITLNEIFMKLNGSMVVIRNYFILLKSKCVITIILGYHPRLHLTLINIFLINLLQTNMVILYIKNYINKKAKCYSIPQSLLFNSKG